MRTLLAIVLLPLLTALTGCAGDPDPVEPDGKNYEAPLPPGGRALRRLTDPRQVPDLTTACADTTGLRAAIGRSLNYLKKPSSEGFFPWGPITHEQNVASLKAMLALLDRALPPAQMAAEMRRTFDVWTSVGCDGRGTVLFTAYYTPVLSASMTRTDKFKYPLYKPPKGLIKLSDGSPAGPMPDRAAIERENLYRGSELVWLADPFEVYVCHIQGSVRLRLPDEKEMTVGYSANNGHPYKSIRAEMVRDKIIGKRAGLPSMLRYFKEHPDAVGRYTARNPRFVFFEITADNEPRGCLNEPVTPLRSIATDKKIFPRAGLTLIDTRLPRRTPAGTIATLRHSGFALDQDAGGAIRAPGRCDVYIGMGEEAGDLAGRSLSEGRLYYLFLKSQAP
jgi:peptidoglycan lytic transglycosylase A